MFIHRDRERGRERERKREGKRDRDKCVQSFGCVPAATPILYTVIYSCKRY